MRRTFVLVVLVPALVLILVTLLRAWLEFNSPDSSLTKIASANILSLVWMLVAPAVLLARGFSLVQGLASAFVFFVLHRLAIGAVYAMAWANQSKVAGSDDLVRYAAQIREGIGDGEAAPSTMSVFLSNTFLPVGFGLVFVLVIWSITWAVGFRGKRPFAAADRGSR